MESHSFLRAQMQSQALRGRQSPGPPIAKSALQFYTVHYIKQQERQHPLTGQRAANFRRDIEET